MIARRLFDIAADEIALEELMLEADGEITEAAEALIADHLANLEGKADSYAALIREWEADAVKFEAEAARVASHATARKNAAQRLKVRLCDALGLMGRDKIEGERFTVSRQANPRSVEVLIDPAGLPDDWVRVTPEVRSADKAAMKAALKTSDPLIYGDQPVARLADPTFSLRIR